MGIKVKVTENGRMVLPAAVRKQLGLEKGGTVILEVGDEGVTLRSLEQVLDKVKATFAKYADLPGMSVDDFLANRRADNGGVIEAVADVSALVAVIGAASSDRRSGQGKAAT